jgi:hypothetical protein
MLPRLDIGTVDNRHNASVSADKQKAQQNGRSTNENIFSKKKKFFSSL